MTRTMKILSATTALLAAVSASANADSITASQTASPLSTNASTGGYLISPTTGTITVSSTPALLSSTIDIDSATGSKNVINIYTGATVTNAATSATIEAANDAAAAVINVSGTLSNQATSSAAINLAKMSTNSATIIINGGTVSGSIVGTEATTGDRLTISGTSVVNGNILLGTGTDVLNVVSGTVTGDVQGGAGDDSFNLSGGRINGNITGDAGNDTYVITGGVVSGTISGGANTDTLTFNTGGTYTTLGNINTMETITVNNGTTLQMNHTTDNAANLVINGRYNLGANDTVGTVTLGSTGILDLSSRALDSATTGSFALGSNIRTTISDSTHIGSLQIADNINDINNSSLTVVLGSNAGYIANGTSKTILIGNAANTATPTLLTTSQGVYTFTVSTTGTNGDISLTINRTATGNLVQSEAGKAIGALLETVSSSASGNLLTMQSVVSQQTTAAGVNNVVESWTPAADTGAAITSVNVGVGVGGNVSTRLAGLRTSGLATGDYTSTGHMWVQGFGAMGEQDDQGGNRGFESTTAGASFGIDTDTLMNGSTVGAAFSYGMSTVDSNASNNASTDINSYIGTLYGSRVYDSGVFLNAQGSFGVNNNETERQAIGFTGKTTGDYTSYQYGAKVEAGRDLAVGSMVLTPLASLQYTYLNGDEYTETGPTAQVVNVESFSTLDAGAGANVAWNLPLEGGATLRPSLRAKYIYRMGDNQGETTSRFVAGGPAFATTGVEADRSSVNVGGGLALVSAGATELSLDYDADIRSSYTGHTGQLKLKWAF